MNSIEHFINGKTVKGSSKRTAKVFNPATGEVSSNVNLANTNDLNKAVDAANKAFTSLYPFFGVVSCITLYLKS